MPKKSIIAVLSAMVLCMVAGLALVFSVGPLASAADNDVVELKEWDDFEISGSRLTGLSQIGRNKIGNSNFKVTIPYGVSVIADTAFNDNLCSNLLISADLSNSSVSIINNDAFASCYNLANIEFPTTLSVIDAGAFWMCRSLSNLDFSKTNLSKIIDAVFYGCLNLTYIEFPATLTDTDGDNNLFDNCPKLTALIAPNAAVANSYKSGVLKYWANKVTYAAGLQINLNDQDNEPSVYLEKQLVGSGFNNWHYVNGQWVQGSHTLAALPTLPEGWVWQFGDAELTADKVQELYNAAVSAERLDTINATAVKIATEPENPDTGDGDYHGGDNNGGEDGEDNGDEGGEDTDPDDPDNGDNTDPSDPNNPDNGDGNGGDKPTDPTSPDDSDSDSGNGDNITDATDNTDPQDLPWWEQATYIGLCVLGLGLLVVFGFCMTKIAILEHAYRKMVKAMKMARQK